MKKAILAIAALAAFGAFAHMVTLHPASGDVFSVGGQGGKIVAVQAFSPTQSGGSLTLQSIWSADVYTNGSAVAYSTNVAYQVAYSNTVTAAVFTNAVAYLPPPVQVYANVIGIVTNETIVATTNSWRGWQKTVAATNDIISGATATGNVYSGAPASDTYVSGFENLIFTGTAATGGWLRIVVE